jgi:CNT family concentrative nucleoside transporter
MPGIVQPLFGAVVISGIAVACSKNRRAINWATVGWGSGCRSCSRSSSSRPRWGSWFERLGAGMNKLLGFAGVGAGFVFGPLGDSSVWSRAMIGALGPEGARYGVVFAFQVLPTIIFIAALFAILYCGLMQMVVRLFAVVMHRVMKCSGASR